jgi:quercetin dioxygenase-like cupin family protein
VSALGSVSALVGLLTRSAHVVVIEIGPGGIVGQHPAAAPQLFVVVEGEGWVRGDDLEQEPIRAGEAVFWERGEEHASGSEMGMTALAIETESLQV